MAKTKTKKTKREAVMVYLDAHDRALLERLARKTGLPRTELLRRGLRHVAGQELSSESPGSAFEYLVETASDQSPSDLSERADDYLYGGGYLEWFVREKAPRKKKRARVR
jgi:hypothetical protein